MSILITIKDEKISRAHPAIDIFRKVQSTSMQLRSESTNRARILEIEKSFVPPPTLPPHSKESDTRLFCIQTCLPEISTPKKRAIRFKVATFKLNFPKSTKKIAHRRVKKNK